MRQGTERPDRYHPDWNVVVRWNFSRFGKPEKRRTDVQLLRVEDVARMLNLSKSEIYSIKEKIGFYKIGGAIRFSSDDVESFLASCRSDGHRVERNPPVPRLKHLHV